MPITIEDLQAMVAAGASAEAVFLAVKPMLIDANRIIAADTERRERLRAGTLKRVTRYRALRNALPSVTEKDQQNQQPPCNALPSVTPSYSPNLSLTDVPIGTSVRVRKQRKQPLPDDWNPVVLEADAAELARFKDYAKANGKLYADWDAAWRNWRTSPYRKPNGAHGNGSARTLPKGNVSIDDIHELAERCREREAEIERGGLFGTTDDVASRRSSR